MSERKSNGGRSNGIGGTVMVRDSQDRELGRVVGVAPSDPSECSWECYPQVAVRVVPDPTSTSKRAEVKRVVAVAVGYLQDALKGVKGVEVLGMTHQLAASPNYLPFNYVDPEEVEFTLAPSAEEEEPKPRVKKKAARNTGNTSVAKGRSAKRSTKKRGTR